MKMKRKKKIRSLKSRLIITLCTFSLLLTLIFSGLIIMTGTLAQDSIFNGEVKNLSEQLYAQYLQGGINHEAVSDKFVVSIGFADLAPALVTSLGLQSLPEGIYESQEPVDYHYTVTKLPDTTKRLYVLYDVTELEQPYSAESLQLVVVIIPAIITIFFGVMVGLLLADKIISPVTRLAARVRETEPDLTIKNLSEGFSEDEVGELARTIESYMQRLSEFITREQQFTRNVSHEFRTPLAVIKNGAELLRGNVPDRNKSEIEVLNRIDRAVGEMEELITAFLILGRENDISHHFTSCDVSGFVEKLVNKYEYLLIGKRVTYRVVREDNIHIEAPELMVSVILGNLIRNAFQYATEGTIEIKINHPSVVIMNKTAWAERSQEQRDTITHGIGHSIIARLCEQLGYDFTFVHSIQTATAKVAFN
jgi:signal transduction histidine kinase